MFADIQMETAMEASLLGQRFRLERESKVAAGQTVFEDNLDWIGDGVAAFESP